MVTINSIKGGLDLRPKKMNRELVAIQGLMLAVMARIEGHKADKVDDGEVYYRCESELEELAMQARSLDCD